MSLRRRRLRIIGSQPNSDFDPLFVRGVDDTASMEEDETVLVDVVANDVGVGLSINSPTILDGSPGTVSLESGQIRYDPGTSFFSLQPPQTQDVRIQYNVTNGTNSDTAILTITVVGINQSPQLDNPIPDQVASVGVSFVFTFAENTFSDPDNT